jgi:ferritin
MNIDSNLEVLFQSQMNRELSNANAYAELAGSLEAAGWDGFAKWMRKASAEELAHYQRFNDFLVDRNAKPRIAVIPQPMEGPGDPMKAFELALEVEQINTQKLIELDKACENVGDCDAEYWLIWALDEQRRSEREIQDVLIKMGRLDCSAAWLILDEQMGGEE